VRKFVLAAALALALVVGIPSALAQDGTGAQAFKDCPGATASPGDTITCNFAVSNTGDVPATITSLTETSPDPGGNVANISCTNGGTTYDAGDVLPNGIVCVGSFVQTVPNDPALCGTSLRDRVTIELAYLPGPLTAGAFATHTTLIVCPADISVTKSASALSKVGDTVNYSITVTNNGDGNVNRTSVNDSLVGDISANFAATLAPGGTSTYAYSRVVQAGDPDPLLNTVTAIYGAGASSDTATASASTNLFQPSITISKNCAPNPVAVGQNVLCTIVISNTSSNDAPALQASSIPDTRSGNLLGANPNVVSTNCGTGLLISGGSCTIVTTLLVTEAMRPGPLTNSVTVNTNPVGFPNLISATANASVAIVPPPPPPGGEGCTPGYWKQSQHFDSWQGYSPNQSYEAVFGVDVPGSPTLLQALQNGGGGVDALERHSVAALLNASSSGVDSDFTTAQVIAIVQDGIAPGGLTIEQAKNLLAAANEQGCPLN
jgi:uncharacterized repeat protein (TIGR01451 family)